MPRANGHKAPSPKKTTKQTIQTAPKDEEIRLRAYELFLSRNGAPGNELDDWLRAERELTTR